ncbi:hypothetical protein KXD96_05635 [Mycobacterium sp. SMC-2]|uniref:hypothetical protein n=1 Tax=Mycobacterium sp. SMC-2 TaxID=2857058 RepID=UPI0021B2F1C6|nr:hypothetical protein [Mycobacterium sp. SMC-2]UXA07603.1 hypothetical protein KXD96_05635 [Mycobacterium sp. SMC-2]
MAVRDAPERVSYSLVVSPPVPIHPPKPAVPDELTPTRKLLRDIIDGGGILNRNSEDDKTSYRSLVGIINRRRMAPDGQQVILIDGAKYGDVILRLSAVSDWKTTPPADVVSAKRVARWHPAVATLRTEKRLDSIDRSLRDRAFRLLHAVAREAEARGHSVRLPKRNVHGYIEDPSRLGGDLILTVEGVDCSVDILQPKARVPHTPTREELERDKKYSWPPPRYDYVPADRLSIALDTRSRFSSKIMWPESKTLPLEHRLPDVMTTFERWAVIDAEHKDAERRQEIERQRIREEAERLAEIRHAENVRTETLRSQHAAWREARELREFLDTMKATVDAMSHGTRRDAAAQWLAWCRQYVDESLDPLSQPLAMPVIRRPTWDGRMALENAFVHRLQRDKAARGSTPG